MRSARLLIVAATLAALTVSRWLEAQSRPPAAERQDVTDVYFGTTITDPYRWLENWHEGKSAGWLKAQDRYTRSALAAISGRDKFLARVKSLDTASTGVPNARSWGWQVFLSQS
jgi:prolyl oligopeptidase